MTIGLEVLKVSKTDQFENLDISSHGEPGNITFGHHVNLIQRVQLGPLP